MKRLLTVMLVLASMVFSTVGFAGERAGAFSVSPYVGGYSYDGMQHLQTRPVYGLRLGYDLTDNWEAEGVFDYVATESTTTGEDMDAYSYRLDILYNFIPAGIVVPYLAVGGGGTTVEDQRDAEDTNATFNFGGGVKWFMTDSVALRGARLITT